MTEVAFLLSFGRCFPVHCVVLGEGLWRMAFETRCVIFLFFRMVPVQGHSGGGAFRCHEEENEDGRAADQENSGLNFFIHVISTVCA